MAKGDLERLRQARDRIDRDYAAPLNVPELARGAFMSTGHFARRFKEAFGETPYSYLLTRRIERAKTLLRRGDLALRPPGVLSTSQKRRSIRLYTHNRMRA